MTDLEGGKLTSGVGMSTIGVGRGVLAKSLQSEGSARFKSIPSGFSRPSAVFTNHLLRKVYLLVGTDASVGLRDSVPFPLLHRCLCHVRSQPTH